jgi:DNA-binding response OmpR family regulator
VRGYALGKKILIIDDTPPIAGKLKRFLELWDYEVFLSEDWADAFESVHRKKPDLIILNTQFADVYGTRYFRMLTEVEEFVKIPLIIKRAASQAYIPEEKAIASFVRAYNPLELLDVVKKTIGE